MLVILHATDVLGPSQTAWLNGSAIDPTQIVEAAADCGREVLAGATARARMLAPELEVHEVLSQADPRNALMAEGRAAATIVVGSRGRGSVASLLLGSVSIAVSKHARCPVVVIRPREQNVVGEGVLVGVDGTELDHDVVEFAFRLASLRALPLTVVHSFWDALHLDPDEHQVIDEEAGLDDKRQLLRDAVQDMAGKFPDVHYRLELMRGFPDRRLAERARLMDLVVVGYRPPGLRTLVFSSIAPTVVEHAPCTVAVVPLLVSG